MADDDLDFMERAESAGKKLYGKPIAADEVIDNFALRPRSARRRARKLRCRVSGEIDSGSHSLRRQVQLMGLHKENGRRS